MADINEDDYLCNGDFIDLTSELDCQATTDGGLSLLIDTEKPVHEVSSIIDKTFGNSAPENPVSTGQNNNTSHFKSKIHPDTTGRVTEFGYSEASRNPVRKKKDVILSSSALKPPSPETPTQSVNMGVSDIVLTASSAEVINKKFPVTPIKRSRAIPVDQDEDVIFMSSRKLKVRPALKPAQPVKAPVFKPNAPKPISHTTPSSAISKLRTALQNATKSFMQTAEKTSAAPSSNTQKETVKETQPPKRKHIQPQETQPVKGAKSSPNLHKLKISPKAKSQGEVSKAPREASASDGVSLNKDGMAQKEMVQNPFSQKGKDKPGKFQTLEFCFSHNGERKTYRRIVGFTRSDSEPSENATGPQEKASQKILNADMQFGSLQREKSFSSELVLQETGKSNISNKPAASGQTSSAQSKNADAQRNAPLILNETLFKKSVIGPKKIREKSPAASKLKKIHPERLKQPLTTQVFPSAKRDKEDKAPKLSEDTRPIQKTTFPPRYSIEPLKDSPLSAKANSEMHRRDSSGISNPAKDPQKANVGATIQLPSLANKGFSSEPPPLIYRRCIKSEGTDKASLVRPNVTATEENPLKVAATVESTIPTATPVRPPKPVLRNPLNGQIVRNKELQKYMSDKPTVNLTDLAETASAVANINEGGPEGAKKNPVIYLLYPPLAPFKEGQIQQMVALVPTATGLRPLPVVNKSNQEFGSADFPLLPLATNLQEKTQGSPPVAPAQEPQPAPPVVPPSVANPLESGDDDVIFVGDDDAEEVTPDIEIEPAAVVTPVDIKTIINGFKKPFYKGRCVYNKDRQTSKRFKGFSHREQKQSSCLEDMKSIAKQLRTAVRKEKQEFLLKYLSNVIYCTSDENGFLPEVTKTEIKEEIEEIEVITIRDDEENGPDILPTLGDMISQVNREVIHLQRPQDTGNNRELPPEALALIKKGLEMIKNWSHETGTSQMLETIIRDKLEQPVVTKKNVPATASNRQESAKPPKKKGKPGRKRKEPQNGNKAVEGSPAVKRNRAKFDDCDDLMVVKRVDILGGKKRGRKPKPKNL